MHQSWPLAFGAAADSDRRKNGSGDQL